MIYLLYTAVILVLVGFDQLLKVWTVHHLELGRSMSFIPGFLQLTRVHNYGAAWSSLSGKTVLLVAVTAALQQLGMDRDSVSVEVLENAKSGFLGIGASPAKVKVT